MKFTLRHADKFVGVFFIIAAVFISTALIVLGSNQRWFSRDVIYYTELTSAAGLSRNMQITLSGFAIGKVQEFTLTAPYEVQVTLLMYEEFTSRIKYGSVVELKSNPLGLSSELVLYPGRDTGDPLPSGSSIPSIGSPEGQELVNAKLVALPPVSDPIALLLAQAGPLLTNVNALVLNLNKSITTANQLVGNIDRNLRGEGAGPVGEMLSDLSSISSQTDRLIANQLTSSLDDLNTMTASLADLMSKPDGLVPRLVGATDTAAFGDSIQGTLEEMEVLMAGLAQLGQGLGRSTPQLSTILNQTTTVLEETRKVLEGLRNNPLLSGGVTQQREIPQEQGGYRNAEF